MSKKLVLDIDNITFGQVEFLGEQTGYSVNELMDRLRTGDFMGKDLVAIMALAMNPDDPHAAMDEIRRSPIADIKLQIPETTDES